MANRSYLLAVDDRSITWSDDPEREIVAEGIDEIPVFWASLFVDGDKQIETFEGDPEALMVSNWCVDSASAKRRLAGLRGPIGKLLDDRSREVWFSFVDHLSAAESTYLKTNGAEVWSLDPDGYDRYWATLLRPFAEPTAENLKAAIEATDPSFEDGSVRWDDDEETICKLAGAEHIRDVPWLD